MSSPAPSTIMQQRLSESRLFDDLESRGSPDRRYDVSIRTAATTVDGPRRSSVSGRSQSGISPASRASNISTSTEPDETCVQLFRRVCRNVVEHKFVVALTTLLTVWVLLSEDLKVILTDRPADIYIGWIGISCMAVFTLEIVLSSIGKDDYFLGFFFFLDVVSTASLILDLPWISDAMNETEDSNSVVSDAERGRTARIGARSARVVRVIRLVRIAKLYKAVYESTRRNKIQATASVRPGEDDDEEEKDKQGSESRVGKKLSDVTTRRVIILVLSMLTILPTFSVDASLKLPTSGQFGADLVWLALQAAGPVGSDSHKAYQTTLLRYIYYHNWFTGNTECPSNKASPACPTGFASHLYWIGFTGQNLTEMELLAERAQLTEDVVNEWVASVHQQDEVYNYGSMPSDAVELLYGNWSLCTMSGIPNEKLGISLLQKEIPGYVDWAAPCWYDLRPTERSSVSAYTMSVTEAEELRMDFWFDERPYAKIEADFSIATTAFVCFVLCTAAMLFYNDVNQLVLYPVEEMITKVQAIRDNPLRAVDLAEQAYSKEVKDEKVWDVLGDESTMTTRQDKSILKKRMAQVKRCLACYSSKPSEPMEMVILEKTIIKLGSLLALGFGEAGSQIIASNMIGSSYGVNVMVPGERIDCVLGHARIQNFSVVTEVLQSRVMTFVNQVAEIVHGVVEEHHGAANKNNGDTFLLVWRCKEMPEDEWDELWEEELTWREKSKYAEMSVLAFSKIVGAVHRSSTLATYRGHPGLQNKLGSTYRVHLTFGLHFGWAIEGAVGSEYKIEASYLSPNVAVSQNLEAATEFYNVCFIASEDVVGLCGRELQNKCRLIDRVLVPGSTLPIELYSVDLDWRAVRAEKRDDLGRPFRARERMKARQWLEAEKQNKNHQDRNLLFERDPDISEMRGSARQKEIYERFAETFRMGYQNYVEGEWQVARRFLEETCTMQEAVDGPSWALIRFMERPHFFEAPPDWRGVHDLSAVLQGSGVSDLGELSRDLAWVAQKRGFKGGPVVNTRVLCSTKNSL